MKGSILLQLGEVLVDSCNCRIRTCLTTFACVFASIAALVSAT